MTNVLDDAFYPQDEAVIALSCGSSRVEGMGEAIRRSREFDEGHHANVEQTASAVTAQLESTENGPRVAIAQVKTDPGQFEATFEKIKVYIGKAEASNADIIVFPELTIPGYLALDNFREQRFIDENLKVLRSVADFTKGKSITAIIGFVDKGPEDGSGRCYNSAAVIRNGEVVDVIDKTLLPDYDIFWEPRYFASARKRNAVDIAGTRFGVQICEDLWDKNYSCKVSDELAEDGAKGIINLSASPFHLGKVPERAEAIRSVVDRHSIPFLYANLVGAQDGYEGEVVFDGRSMAFGAGGQLLGMGKAFQEDLVIVDCNAPKGIALPEWTSVEELHDGLVLGIGDYFGRNGLQRAYIGLSGGIDSAVTAALAVEALGADSVIGVTMPSHVTGSETKNDAVLLAQNLGMQCFVRPIEEQYRAWERAAMEQHGELDSITKQNSQARIRGNILMEFSNQMHSGAVISTGNKTEMALGYCTLYGDMTGGLAAISDVNKMRVYELARYVNERAGSEVIPWTTIERPPTAELEEDQLDSENLPADYPVLSPLVDDIVERRVPRDELIAKYGDASVVDRTIRMVQLAEFKRRQAPPGIRVTEKAFGSGRRLPVMSGGFY